MKCYNCGCQVRESTIICPVCNQLQNLSIIERLFEYLKNRIASRNLQKRSPLMSR